MFIAYIIMLFAILSPLILVKLFFVQKAEKKKSQILNNEGVLVFGAPRKGEEMRKTTKDLQKDAQKHSYLWLYEEED